MRLKLFSLLFAQTFNWKSRWNIIERNCWHFSLRASISVDLIACFFAKRNPVKVSVKSSLAYNDVLVEVKLTFRIALTYAHSTFSYVILAVD